MVKDRLFTVREVARATSTQDVVRRAARSGAADGFCCVATEQTAGRGRLGRSWHAPPGTSLLTSVLLRVREAALPGVPFAAGLAVHDALWATSGLWAGLKWPNDVMVSRRKLAGVLVEVCPEAARVDAAALIVGLGVNLTVDAFPPGVNGVSLHRLVGNAPPRGDLLRAWLRCLDARTAALEHEGLATILEDWRTRATGLGGRVRIALLGRSLEGRAEGVRDDGALLVRNADGLTAVLAGDVQLLDANAGVTRTPQT